jgi:hypothetical protein
MNGLKIVDISFRNLPNSAPFGTVYRVQEDGSEYTGRGLNFPLVLTNNGQGYSKPIAFQNVKNVPLTVNQYQNSGSGFGPSFSGNAQPQVGQYGGAPVRAEYGDPFYTLQNSNQYLLKSFDGKIWFSTELLGYLSQGSTPLMEDVSLMQMKSEGGNLYILNNRGENQTCYGHVSLDKGKTWRRIVDETSAPRYFNDVIYDEVRKCWWMMEQTTLFKSLDGFTFNSTYIIRVSNAMNRIGIFGHYLLGLSIAGVLTAVNLDNIVAGEQTTSGWVGSGYLELVITNNSTALLFNMLNSYCHFTEVDLRKLTTLDDLRQCTYQDVTVISRMAEGFLQVGNDISLAPVTNQFCNTPIVYGSTIAFFNQAIPALVISFDHGRTWELQMANNVFYRSNYSNGMTICEDLGLIQLGCWDTFPMSISMSCLENN